MFKVAQEGITQVPLEKMYQTWSCVIDRPVMIMRYLRHTYVGGAKTRAVISEHVHRTCLAQTLITVIHHNVSNKTRRSAAKGSHVVPA